MIGFQELFIGTFLSEDLTCITAGILLKEKQISTLTGLTACLSGIFLGDLLLFFSGKFLSKVMCYIPYLQKIFIKMNKFQIAKKNLARLIFLSRFVPGTRLPLYFAIGAANRNYFLHFALYTALACILWTPLILSLAYLYGKEMDSLFQYKHSLSSYLFLVVSFFLIYRFSFLISSKENRNKMMNKIQKFTKVEFWSAWFFYIPIVFFIFRLILKHKGIRYITASNPGIVHSGIAGESKSEILAKLPSAFVPSYFVFDPLNKNLPLEESIQNSLQTHNIHFPVIIKPDIGERGAGVKLIESYDSLIHTLKKINVPYIIQNYSLGPLEAGIFYYRFPNQEKGNIFSITDKKFPFLVGDGIHSLEWQIQNHPRYKFQSNVFLENHKQNLEFVIPKDEIFPLGFAGNHCQGCMFVDGNNLITEELETKIDEISKQFQGFYFGRFDIRYAETDSLRKGINFEIIELNGATSESTNVYDPMFSISQTYSYLFKQWEILFEIGYLNFQKGEKISTWKEIFQMLKNHFKYKENLNPLSEII